jgi:hypothetical protein
MLMDLARQRSIDVIPRLVADRRGKTIVEQDGRFWELVSWMPGEPLDANRLDPAPLADLARVLRRIHGELRGPELARALTPITDPKTLDAWIAGERAPAPGITRRLDAWRRLAPLIQFPCPADHPEIDRVQRTISLARERSILFEHLADWAQTPLPLALVVRDIHRRDVLFSADRVTGIVDLGAIAIDSPLFDWARFGASVGLGTTSRASWEDFLVDEPGRILSSADRLTLVRLIARTSQVLAALHWLQWLVVERRPFSNLTAAWARWDEVLAQIEADDIGLAAYERGIGI